MKFIKCIGVPVSIFSTLFPLHDALDFFGNNFAAKIIVM